jgi:uncharacterized membrane protein
MINWLTIVLILIATIGGAFGSFFFKKASSRFNLNILAQLRNTELLLGMLIFTISTLSYLFALRTGGLSIIYSLTSLTYIWISIISVKFLKEKMNKHKLLGISLIVIGIFLISCFSV